MINKFHSIFFPPLLTTQHTKKPSIFIIEVGWSYNWKGWPKHPEASY